MAEKGLENIVVMQLVTVHDEERRLAEREFLLDAGLDSDDISEHEARSGWGNVPPVAYQRIAGVYMASIRKGPDASGTFVPSASVFTAAGNDEAGLVSFVFGVFDAAEKRMVKMSGGGVVPPQPLVVAGNGGYAMRIVLSRACAHAREAMKRNDSGFDIGMHERNLSRFLNTEDKWGANWLNQYSKTLFDPSSVDSLGSVPVEGAGRRLFGASDWHGILRLVQRAGDRLAERTLSIKALVESPKFGSSENIWKKMIRNGLPSPVAFEVLDGLEGDVPTRRKVPWEEVERYSPRVVGEFSEVF